MKKHKTTIIMVLFFFIGLLTLFYPTLSNYYNEKNQSKTIYNYENIIKKMDTKDFKQMKDEAIAYNKKLAEIKEPLYNYDTIKGYNKLLNINDKGMIGYLSIDKIKVELPIYHTTSDNVLTSFTGHLEGSSLPIGGTGTHSVLSAHRGLPSSKLFSDLDKLEIGDTFIINVLDETLTYQVDKITVVKPNNIKNLKIDKNEDYVTLLTCTPYGINTKRLLVRGKRIKTINQKRFVTTEGFKINKLIAIPIIAAPVVLILIIILIIKPVKKIDLKKYDIYLYPNGRD